MLERLVRWRKKAIADGIAEASGLRVSFLRSLARQGLRSVEEIASSLPTPMAHLAPALAAALREHGPTAPPDDGDRAARPQPGPVTNGGADATSPAPDEPDTRRRRAVVDARLKGVTFVRFDDRAAGPPAGRLTVTASPTGGVVLTWDEAGRRAPAGTPPPTTPVRAPAARAVAGRVATPVATPVATRPTAAPR